MNGHIVATEVGYNVYLGDEFLTDATTYEQAVYALRDSARWNGRIFRSVSPHRTCA